MPWLRLCPDTIVYLFTFNPWAHSRWCPMFPLSLYPCLVFRSSFVFLCHWIYFVFFLYDRSTNQFMYYLTRSPKRAAQLRDGRRLCSQLEPIDRWTTREGGCGVTPLLQHKECPETEMEWEA